MFKKLDFMKVSKDLNTLKDTHKEYTSKELVELMSLCNLPVNGSFRKALVDNKILEVLDHGRNGTFYKFIPDSIFYLNLEAAHRQYRKMRTSKNSVKPVSDSSNKSSGESEIQAAIALLKAQGDRFKITEKVVTVEFKDL